MKKINNIKRYVIGVDGGGTKTVALLSDYNGRILMKSKTGPSNLRNIGLERAIVNVCQAISKLIERIDKKRVISIVVALAAFEEEFKRRKIELENKILNNLNFPKHSKIKIEVVSDQWAAFRAGTDSHKGLILIAGTGSVCHGWKNGEEKKAGGWGWLADEGSGFWIGQKGYRAVFKAIDRRKQKTRIKELMFKKWKIKNRNELMERIYSTDVIRMVSLISRIVDQASREGDQMAVDIMRGAGEELSLMAKTVIKKLNLQKEEFPLVLIGGVFKSKIVLDTVKKVIKDVAPYSQFILLKGDTALGAVRLALRRKAE